MLHSFEFFSVAVISCHFFSSPKYFLKLWILWASQIYLVSVSLFLCCVFFLSVDIRFVLRTSNDLEYPWKWKTNISAVLETLILFLESIFLLLSLHSEFFFRKCEGVTVVFFCSFWVLNGQTSNFRYLSNLTTWLS